MKRIISIYRLLTNKNYSTIAGSIAFFIVVNGGAILFLIIKLLSYFEADIVVNIPYLNIAVSHIRGYTGGFSVLYSIFFIITSIWSASTLFYHLIKSFELIYGIKKKFNTLYRLVAVFFVILFLALLLSGAILQTIIKSVIGDKRVLYKLYELIILFIAPIAVILFFNMFLCPVNIRFKNAIKGSTFTFLFWIVVTFLFNIYIKYFSNYKKLYGALAMFVIFMVWIYLISIGLVIGFIINERYYLNLDSKLKNNDVNNIKGD